MVGSSFFLVGAQPQSGVVWNTIAAAAANARRAKVIASAKSRRQQHKKPSSPQTRIPYLFALLREMSRMPVCQCVRVCVCACDIVPQCQPIRNDDGTDVCVCPRPNCNRTCVNMYYTCARLHAGVHRSKLVAVTNVRACVCVRCAGNFSRIFTHNAGTCAQ